MCVYIYRSYAISVATLANWSCAFIVTGSYEFFQNILTTAGVFWFYSLVLLWGVWFVYTYVEETRGLSLEQIEAMFDTLYPPLSRAESQSTATGAITSSSSPDTFRAGSSLPAQSAPTQHVITDTVTDPVLNKNEPHFRQFSL